MYVVQKLHVPCLSLPEQSTYPAFTVAHDPMCSTFLHVILLTLLQHKYCKYDYTLTIPLTSACCVHSNVYGLGNIC